MINSEDVKIRAAEQDDIPTLKKLIESLASFEKLSHAVTATHLKLDQTLFGETRAAEILIAEHENNPIGFVLFFTNYSTFLGQPGIYIEDLFVEENFRKSGVGIKLISSVAKIARKRDCGRLEGRVLNWNQNAIDVYEKFGAKAQKDWIVYQLDSDGIEKVSKLSGDHVSTNEQKPQSASNHQKTNSNWLKWITIGLLGSLSIFALVVVFLVKSITPIVDYNKEDGKLSILNGFILVDEDSGQLRIGDDVVLNNVEEHEFYGEHQLNPSMVESIEFDFVNGNIEIESSQSQNFTYDCKTYGGSDFEALQKSDGRFHVDLSSTFRVDCKVSVPNDVHFIAHGSNASVTLLKPNTHIDVLLNNGRVAILEDKNKKYDYDLKITNGHMDNFQSSKDPKAIIIKVVLGNGSIANAREEE